MRMDNVRTGRERGKEEFEADEQEEEEGGEEEEDEEEKVQMPAPRTSRSGRAVRPLSKTFTLRLERNMYSKRIDIRQDQGGSGRGTGSLTDRKRNRRGK